MSNEKANNFENALRTTAEDHLRKKKITMKYKLYFLNGSRLLRRYEQL